MTLWTSLRLVDGVYVKKDSNKLLKKAGLERAVLTEPGITRKKSEKKSWVYFDSKGRPIKEKSRIDTFNKIVLPPAWTDVWINPKRNGHIIATGLDGKGRLQYRYHPDWIAVGSEAKYGGVAEFADHLPALRKVYQSDVRMKGMPKRKIVAAVVWLMDLKGIRIGNDEYARKNHHYGLTTIQDGHIQFQGDRKAILQFRAKSGKDRHIVVDESRALVKLLRKCQEVGGIHPEVGDGGQDLFRYIDATGKDLDIKSHHINQYIYDICGAHFTAKDFRTWMATWKMAERIGTLIQHREEPSSFISWAKGVRLANWEKFGNLEKKGRIPLDSATAMNRALVTLIDSVSADLGNTRTVCRGSYIHPGVVDDFLSGKFEARWKKTSGKSFRDNLTEGENRTLLYLRSHR